ncbi:hypothetical protein SAMN05216303_11142 [Rhodoferax sp. OV413]|nr:hypothetical protein SAMN05216303_11142 [Rhodoferax sp. OV413]
MTLSGLQAMVEAPVLVTCLLLQMLLMVTQAQIKTQMPTPTVPILLQLKGMPRQT